MCRGQDRRLRASPSLACLVLRAVLVAVAPFWAQPALAVVPNDCDVLGGLWVMRPWASKHPHQLVGYKVWKSQPRETELGVLGGLLSLATGFRAWGFFPAEKVWRLSPRPWRVPLGLEAHPSLQQLSCCGNSSCTCRPGRRGAPVTSCAVCHPLCGQGKVMTVTPRGLAAAGQPLPVGRRRPHSACATRCCGIGLCLFGLFFPPIIFMIKKQNRSTSLENVTAESVVTCGL